jgi:PAS domain S-box-containing protein
MLDGGENQEGRFIALDNPLLREKIEQTIAGITAFKAIARERWEARTISGAGSDIDQRFDQVFADFMSSADGVETALQQAMQSRLSSFEKLQSILVAMVLGLGICFCLLLRQHEKKRVSHILSLQDKEGALRNLRNYLSNIIDSMPSILVGVDPSGEVTQWNYEAERVTGVTINQAVGKNLQQVCPRLAGEMNLASKAISTRQKQIDAKRVRVADKEKRYEDVVVYPLVANGVEGAVIRVDDVTERVRVEEIMVQSDKMLSIGGLAAGMAHEINNPLAGIMQSAQVLSNRLMSEIDTNKRAADEAGTSISAIRRYMQIREIPTMLEQIQQSGSRAAEIVVNMLRYAHKGEGAFSSHNLNELLDRTVDLAGSDYDLLKKYDFRKITITRNYAPTLPLLPCNASMIQQVILNLLRNGAEAMWQHGAEHQPHFILTTAYDAQQKMLSFEIEDNGVGMEETVCKRIFEPFFTTKDVGLGTGLGLSVSYFIIAESHGGQISVESQPGHGTKFIVKLPSET